MRIAILITLALLSATAAQGQPAAKNVVSGNLLKLSFFNSTNPDCSSRGRSEIRLIRVGCGTTATSAGSSAKR